MNLWIIVIWLIFSSMMITLWMFLVLTVLEVVDVFSLYGFYLFESCFSISLDFLFIICLEFYYFYYWSIKIIRILKFSHFIYFQCTAFLNNIHNTCILSILVSKNKKIDSLNFWNTHLITDTEWSFAYINRSTSILNYLVYLIYFYTCF